MTGSTGRRARGRGQAGAREGDEPRGRGRGRRLIVDGSWMGAARSDAILFAIDYASARRLDLFRRERAAERNAGYNLRYNLKR